MSTPAHADDPAARCRELFDRELGYVWATVRRLGVPSSDAEDVCHDVFVQVYGKISSYDPTRPPKPWLFGFAFRVATDYKKRAYHTREVARADVDGPSDRPSAEHLLEEKDTRALVASALSAVDLDRRAVLIAHEMDEIPMKEIAESLGIPVNTAYSRLRVAREEFAEAVRRLRSRRGER